MQYNLHNDRVLILQGLLKRNHDLRRNSIIIGIMYGYMCHLIIFLSHLQNFKTHYITEGVINT